MQPDSWPAQHSDALREYLARGLSYSEIANIINAKFGTNYTRNAVIGRGRRLGLGHPARPAEGPKGPRLPKHKKRDSAAATKARAAELAESKASPADSAETCPAAPPPRQAPRIRRLRCVGVSPRLLPLTELESCDCRYPYGGDKDGEP